MAIKRLVVNVEMEDGKEHYGIKTNLKDQMLFAQTAKKHGWQSIQDGPMTWLNFMAFSALKRQGLFEGGWEAFCDQCAAVEAVENEDITPTTAER